ASVVIARYTLEHAFDPVRHLDALEALAAGGHVVVEVPDCSDAFRTRDYTTLWEEHVLYLTPGSLRRALRRVGWTIVGLHVYPNALHNALVAVVKRDDPRQRAAGDDVPVDADRA